MGQQPNIEHDEAALPRPTEVTPPADRWRPVKPGLITSPGDVPTGPGFGSAGPDAGWALKLVEQAELPDDDPRLKSVVIGLATARAAALGRGPVHEDIEVALVLCGYGFAASEEVLERRERWLAAVPHEKRPGATAVGDVDKELIGAKPEQVRWALGHGPKSPPAPSAASDGG